jgi:hypothetical protein
LLYVFEIFVIAILILDIQNDIQATKGTGGQAENVDETEDLALREIAPRELEIVLDHDRRV